jgi:hypothetical protein
MPSDLEEDRMKSARRVCPILAAAMLIAAAQAQTPRDQEATNTLYERARIKSAANIDRLKRCMAGDRDCSEKSFSRSMLGLTQSEVEAILGPPHYQFHLAQKHLHYWTISINTDAGRVTMRIQAIYGNCYYREKDSRKEAVCQVRRY